MTSSSSMPIPVFDGHNDCLLDLLMPRPGKERSFFEQSEHGHIDLPRMKQGCVVGGIFAMFVPMEQGRDFPADRDVIITGENWRIPPLAEIPFEYAQGHATNFLDLAHNTIERSDGAATLCLTADQIRQAIANESIAVVLHFEGAEAVKPDLSNLRAYYDRGVRSLGIVWSRPNRFGKGVPFQYPSSPDTGPGLTDEGKALVRACNQMGIQIDLAHLNEKGFWDTARITSKPLVVSHAGVHAITPTSRNITDKQLDAIKETNGLLGITFSVTDIRDDAHNDSDTPVAALVKHIRYVADRIGVDHVAIGSDYDGATIPSPVSDVSKMQVLIEALRESGFDDSALRKIASENWLRVLNEAWSA